MPIMPKIPIVPNKNILTFNEWSDIFSEDIQCIINEYIDFIKEISTKKNLCSTLRVINFQEALKKLIYQTSQNKYKYYLELI
jgi:hypothetical protein